MKAGSFFALGLALASGAAQAAIVNGDFGSGLGSWTKTGNAAVKNVAEFGPVPAPAGQQAVLGTVAASFLFGGTAVSAATLETALGLAPGALGPDAFDGSAISQTFTAVAGDTLRFDLNLYTDDAPDFSDDFAFVALDGVVVLNRSIDGVTLVAAPAPIPFTQQSGFGSFTLPITAAGSHTLAFGIVDVPDDLGASGLGVANVALMPVPEPASWLALMVGLTAVAGVALRRSRAA